MTPLVSLSVYVHTPFCLQRCRYCDFTTFESHEIYSPKEYFSDLHREIFNRNRFWRDRQIQTLYFGGGTPSLVDPRFILSTIDAFANNGFQLSDNAELTIEINPATLTETSLNQYQSAGINRFSVGAQSFNDRLLKMCGRKHNGDDTRQTLKLLKERDLNYSFDLLFALPKQTLADLELDLDEIMEWAPPHLSTYCLTVPEGHPMSFDRPHDDEQVEMFDRIENRLKDIDLLKYELSNFSKPGWESVHNLSYWMNRAFWGVGLSSHSYDPKYGPYGTRFWNTRSLKAYPRQVQLSGALEDWCPADQRETLKLHEAMTDLCHMHLRMVEGLPFAALQNLPAEAVSLIRQRMGDLKSDGLLGESGDRAYLTPEGQLKSNLVFRHLTFLSDELSWLSSNDAGH